ncbi:two-component system sensor histidine kinase QseC [Azospirillum sp. OGB3]|uniref:sensor histidine kinase n=1 Tax=Azospirillum sp. OGB3 TaxID=2587012 RepID=UPI001819F575|nr:HAMP domain-containing sensor histidine kinase [Azospirillum sp. OGB3]MBB3268489.1 two-component system sensor histidine kinase QseC [Azospirillum sp. OGB3]
MNSLRSRLLLVMALVFALGAGNVVIYLLDLDEDIRAHVLNEQVDTLLATVTPAPDGSNLGAFPMQFSASDWRYALYTRTGDLVASAPAGAAPLPFRNPEALPESARAAVTARLIGDNRVLVASRNDWEDCEELCQLFRERMAGSSVVIAILAAISLVSIVFLARWMLGSVRRAADLASTIGVAHPERRIPLRELPEEIVPLAISANQALDRLSSAYEIERRFTADAAHELRTPLAVLDLRLQKARTEPSPDWSAIARDMEQMRHLIDQLLVLARADQGGERAPDEPSVPIELARIVREAVADMLPAYEAASRTIDVAVAEGLVVEDAHRQLRQALRNLLDNAFRHGRGQVSVSLASRDERTAVLRVSDEGPAVPRGEGGVLFERFHKGARNTPGSGLGLAIVRRILRNLGGDARIGAGPTFAIELIVPLAPLAPPRPTPVRA